MRISRVGAVWSILMVTLAEAVPPWLVAWQVSVTPGVSFFKVIGSHPWVSVTGDSGSVTSQLTLTGPTYQSFLPIFPETSASMTGGVVSAGWAGSTSSVY